MISSTKWVWSPSHNKYNLNYYLFRHRVNFIHQINKTKYVWKVRMSSISSLKHKNNSCKFCLNSFYSKVISESNLSSLVPSNLSHSFSQKFCSVGVTVSQLEIKSNGYVILLFLMFFIKGKLKLIGLLKYYAKILPKCNLKAADAAILPYIGRSWYMHF